LKKVQEKAAQTAMRGVSGVPFFIFKEQYALSGAQPSNVILDAMNAA
jgi:predicted DsbA family dithiol-disulfide isomerase